MHIVLFQPSEYSLEFENDHGGIQMFFTTGIHPYNAEIYSKSSMEKLEKCLERPDVVVGPIGIVTRPDVWWKEAQITCFEGQVKLGVKMKMPF